MARCRPSKPRRTESGRPRAGRGAEARAHLTAAAHALAPKRYRLRPRNAVDPIRPEIGSPAPLVINALVAMERRASARALASVA